MEIVRCDYKESDGWFSIKPTVPACIPPWLDVNHPDFPKHFVVTVFDEDGVALYSVRRLFDNFNNDK
jgi:hypothetical protein